MGAVPDGPAIIISQHRADFAADGLVLKTGRWTSTGAARRRRRETQFNLALAVRELAQRRVRPIAAAIVRFCKGLRFLKSHGQPAFYRRRSPGRKT
jgi:hypothetical protein